MADDKVSIVIQFHGVKREKLIPAKWMKVFRTDGVTFAISVGQSYYWDAEQEKWRFHRKLYRPDLFVLDVWGQYSYFAPLDRWVPVNDWEDLTGEGATDKLISVVTEGRFGNKTILEFVKDHELTGEGGFL